MPRKAGTRRKAQQHDMVREAEVMSAPPVTSDYGEGAAVKDLLDDSFLTAPDATALDIALALQQLVRGQASLLANQQTTSEQIARLKARMDANDEASQRWQEDQQKFIKEVLDKADRIKAPADSPEGVKRAIRGSEELQKAMAEARAQVIVSKQSFDRLLEHMPKVKVIWPGHFEMVRDPGGNIKTQLVGESVHIKTKTWNFPPSAEVEVPEIVARALEESKLHNAELDERKALLAKNVQDTKLRDGMAAISRKYGTGGSREELIPVATR